MHRFPEALDLSHLIGGELAEVSIVPYNLLLRLEPTNHLNIEGRWMLLSPDGALFDQGNQQEHKDAYRIHELLQKKITGFKVLDPTILDIEFEEGWHLRILENSDQHESVSISPNIYI